MKRPNILFALADDASHFGIYGHPMVETPCIDSLAKEGILFENAFTTNPKCAPSRASILTGKHTWRLGSGCTHFCEFPENQLLFPDLLEKAGYLVGFTGKGWGPGDYLCTGYSRNPAGTEYNQKTLTPPAGSCISTTDYAANFEDFLNDRKEEQPFYFWYGCREPHRRYQQGEGISHGKNKDLVEVPIYLPDCDTVREDFCDYAFEIDWFDLQLSKIIQKLKEIGEYENTLIVVTSDNGCPFPRIKGQMYEDDFRLPLCITWKDRVMGNRRVSDLVSFLDFAPTFLEVAGAKIPDTFDGHSLTDILYSEKANVVNPERNRVFMGRERHDMGRYLDTGYPVRCVRTPEYLYIHNYHPYACPAGNPETGYPNCDPSPTKKEILHRHAEGDNFYYNLAFGLRPEEQLFDIINDPQCMENLAERSEYRELKEMLAKELIEELKKTHDPREEGNGDIFDTYRYVGNPPHAWSKLNEHYYERLSIERKRINESTKHSVSHDR